MVMSANFFSEVHSFTANMLWEPVRKNVLDFLKHSKSDSCIPSEQMFKRPFALGFLFYKVGWTFVVHVQWSAFDADSFLNHKVDYTLSVK